jgi:Tfp pilus assembly protein PilE
MKRLLHRQDGFTTLELVVVVASIAILATLFVLFRSSL